MSSPSTPNDSLVLSYLGLRKAIGIIGMALPFVLIFGKMLLEGPGIQPSISDYYYTVMRNVFVGSLCSIAIFLMSYRGYERRDMIAGRIACFFAVCTALFPTAPSNPTAQEVMIGTFHLLSAATFFLTLAYFSLALFRKTDSHAPTLKKLQRNMVYTTCGYAIIICIALIVVVQILPENLPIQKLSPVFWLESAAILFFGISWFVKGEAILKDDETVVLPVPVSIPRGATVN